MEGYIKVLNSEDRLLVATILVKNGYTVSQIKKQRTATGKTVDYYLKYEEKEENVTTTK